ncbi:hypothetical protein AOLI_G00306280 [Acnodon oligacanthus]
MTSSERTNQDYPSRRSLWRQFLPPGVTADRSPASLRSLAFSLCSSGAVNDVTLFNGRLRFVRKQKPSDLISHRLSIKAKRRRDFTHTLTHTRYQICTSGAERTEVSRCLVSFHRSCSACERVRAHPSTAEAVSARGEERRSAENVMLPIQVTDGGMERR